MKWHGPNCIKSFKLCTRTCEFTATCVRVCTPYSRSRLHCMNRSPACARRTPGCTIYFSTLFRRHRPLPLPLPEHRRRSPFANGQIAAYLYAKRCTTYNTRRCANGDRSIFSGCRWRDDHANCLLYALHFDVETAYDSSFMSS